MLKSLLRHPFVLSALGWLIGAYLAFVYRTTRWRLEGAENVVQHVAGAPLVVAFWHEHLALMSKLWLTARAMEGHAHGPQAVHVLVSRHRDGQLIGAIIRRFHADVVLGSSSRGGAAGLRNLRERLERGDFVVITPDGPRGPAREAAPGVAQLAALANVAVLPCAAQSSRHRRLNTWDRMILPLPFARAVIVCAPLIAVPRRGWDTTLPAITKALNEACARADAACR